jgi:hypothetical protein
VGASRAAIDHCRDSGAWRAVLRGVYLIGAQGYPSQWRELPFRTRLSAALLCHGRDAVAVLTTAAQLHGLPGLPYDDGAIHLRLPPGRERHQQAGVVMHTWRVPPADLGDAGGTRSTTAIRTLADVTRIGQRADAVALLDAALNCGLVTPDQLAEVEQRLVGRRGAIEARRRLASCDGRAQSPLETRVRLIAADAGLPPHHLQLPIVDEFGVLLGYADMAWDRPGRRILVAEADGEAPHSAPQALYRDRSRANDFVATGNVDMIRFTWKDTRRPEYIVSTLRKNLGPASC